MNFNPILAGLTPDTADRLGDLLFNDERSVYVMLDASQIVGLVERLEGYGLQRECLVRGHHTDELGDHVPWVAKIERGDPLYQDTMSDIGPNGLWDIEPGLFFVTDLDLPTLMRHIRKFHRPRVVETNEQPFLRFWDMELVIGMFHEGIGHIQSLVGPQVSLIGRIGEDAYMLETADDALHRPGKLTEDEKQKIGLILTAQRRGLLADKIGDTFPDYVSHLSRKALEREVHDAWTMANAFGLRDGQVRAKFIITAVALAPGLHHQDIIQDMFRNSNDPDQSFRDFDTVLNRRFDAKSEGAG